MNQNNIVSTTVNPFWYNDVGCWDTRQPERLVKYATRLESDKIDVLQTFYLLDIGHLKCPEKALAFDRQRGILKSKWSTRQLMIRYSRQLGFSGSHLVRAVATDQGLSPHKLPIIHGEAILMPQTSAKRGMANWYNGLYLIDAVERPLMTELVYAGGIRLLIDMSLPMVDRQLKKGRQLQQGVSNYHQRRATPNQAASGLDGTDAQNLNRFADTVVDYFGIQAHPEEISCLTKRFLGTL